MQRRVVLAVILSGFLLLPYQSHATWLQDGVPISTATSGQFLPRAIADDAGGAIIVWEDSRSGTGALYAQRVDALGVPQWTPNGVAVATPGTDFGPRLIPDGAGGVIIAWYRGNDIYAQRLNSAGAPLWTTPGVGISTAAGAQQLPVIASDNAGGAIIAWQDFRSNTDYDLYAQRVSALGVPQWTANGVVVCLVAGTNQGEVQITADGSGGAVFAWNDARTGSGDIYVQRTNPFGNMMWTANGVGLCTAADVQSDPSIVADGGGGAIVAWEDNRTLSWDVYARRVNSNGTPQWTANGVPISAQANFQFNPVLLPDGLGGAFAAWDDGRAGVSDIYAQHLNSSGTALWTANGVALTTGGIGTDPDMVTDGLGGVIVGWEDSRTGNHDIYARRVSSSGVAQWTANGTALCSAANLQRLPALASDGAGGAIAVWDDQRNGTSNSDVYAQRIERNGYWGYPSPNIAKVRDVPGDQGGQINLSWDASRLDLWPDQLIDTYTVWRSLSPAAASSAMLLGEDIRVQEINATTYYWQLIHTIGAYELPGYSDLVPTPFDSTASSNSPIYFQVIAHAGNAQWISQPASGRSVDNLAPAAPLQLAAQRVGSDVHLVWHRNHELDLAHYSVYRHTSSGVTPVPTYFLSSPEDTVLTDANAPAGSLYYIVTAIDTHQNQSAKSNEASVSGATGVIDAPRSYVLSVSNYPNPFNPRTTVSYTVPARGHVKVAVYDARGAHVATLFDGERNAGAYSVNWDGRTEDAAVAASGVYFARIEHNGSARTKKMVLLK